MSVGIPISLRPPLPLIFLFAIHLPPIEEGEFLLYPVKILFAPDIFTLIHSGTATAIIILYDHFIMPTGQIS